MSIRNFFTMFGSAGKALKQDANARLEVANIQPIEEIVIFNDIQLRSTSSTGADLQDLSAYKSLLFIATNTHDQSVDLTLQVYTAGAAGGARSLRIYNGSSFTDNPVTSIPSQPDGKAFILNTNNPLFDSPLKLIRLSAKSTTAPTSGAFRLIVWGVK